MGLFDIFKKNETEKAAQPVSPTAQAANPLPEGYAESLEKTERIAALIAVPSSARDEKWLEQFLSDLPGASFSCGTPQVIAGADGFPYFQLLLPEPGAEFQSFVIDKMMEDFLLERGFGVVINPKEEQPDWVLTYGDLLNLRLNGSFYSAESAFNSHMGSEIVAEKEEVLIGQPSEHILPAQTRKLLKDFFELNGILAPKMLLLMRKKGEETTQDLAFNIIPEQFESEEHYRNMMQTVTWYLPRHYSIIGLKDDVFENGFMPL
ncbi:hypothetical protein ACSBL2_17840 [Pedobacter sp. AW31-3R]|uniref:hypothetical protein n=1 Tax=Pedobacter sp. AW31-3R TaxID=3445781 RepID=UPI003F9ED958